MADNNEYKLTIKIQGDGSGGSNSPVAPTSDGKTNEKESAKAKAKAQRERKKTALKVIAGVSTAYHLIDKIASIETSTITLRTGFEEQQAKYQFYQGIARRGFSIATATISGLIMSGGNPVGAAIGATVSLTSQAIDIMGTMRRVQLERENENTQIFLNSIRMGAGANRGNRE